MAPYERDSLPRQRNRRAGLSAESDGRFVHYLFHVRNMFFSKLVVPVFDPSCPHGRLPRMSDAVATVALGVAVIATIVGLSFHRSEIWSELTRKTPDRSGPSAPIDGPNGGGPTFNCDSGDGSA